jgi:ADP-heptose:LPS heptosyltransferase
VAKQLVLRNFQSPGDIVMLTAAVRDLHRCYPDHFVTDVRTPCPGLWEHNPYLTALDESAPDVEVIDCGYPIIHRSNQEPYHFVHGFSAFLNERLGLNIRPTAFKGDVYVSALETSWISQVEEIVGANIPFWIVTSGGKNDFTIKWWDHQRYQEVVDHFRGRIQFVQVGDSAHRHPPLDGVIDLRGKTDLRQLVRLVYHAQGVLGPVSLNMHLAAAVAMKPEYGIQHRPAVIIAGGREPMQWEAYPHHQFIHTNGALRCCDFGGCWKSRTLPLGDGDEKDRPESLCVDVVGSLPRCMDMITAAEVVRRIEMYFTGGALQFLNAPARVSMAQAPTPTAEPPATAEPATPYTDRPVHPLFKPKNMDEGIEAVVGSCNGLSAKERWAFETPAFAQAILKHTTAPHPVVLDYGCGVGRLAKGILAAHATATVIGVDESVEALALAREYVNDPRFSTLSPYELSHGVDLAYCVYVLQHVPAIQIRDVLQRIHHHLRDDGAFVYCSSDYRMAIRFDRPGFEDDRRTDRQSVQRRSPCCQSGGETDGHARQRRTGASGTGLSQATIRWSAVQQPLI